MIRARLMRFFLSIAVPAVAAGALGADPAFSPRAGEFLRYKLSLAGLALGEEQICIKNGSPDDGRPLLILERSLDSYASLARLVDYHEKRTVVWDPMACRPLREEAAVTQRRLTQKTSIDLLHDLGRAEVRLTDEHGASRNYAVPCASGTQTSSTLLLYLRSFPWERGQNMVPLLGEKGTEWYGFAVKPETRPFRTPLGTFTATYRLTNRELRYDIWFDRGPGHLPLEIRSKLAFGTAVARLIEAKGYN